MKTMIAVLLAVTTCAISPAQAQEEWSSKLCYQRCLEITTADKIKKEVYDYEEVNNDASKTAAEKKKSHKRAIQNVCTRICFE